MESSNPPRQQSLVTMFPYRQSAEGCPLCVICGAELRRKDGKPRQASARYCSARCSDHAHVCTGDTAAIRRLVLDRDGGICSTCGLDCVAAKRTFAKLVRLPILVGRLYWRLPASQAQAWRKLDLLAHRLHRAFGRRLNRLGWNPEQHTWEAHHVVPVVDGGGGCGLQGYATACRPCHKRANAELAARRALLPGGGRPVGQMALPFG